jgi:hypothetical protein
MNFDELHRIWKEAVVARLRYYPSICLERLRKTTKYLRICNVLDNIHTKDFRP